MHFDSVMVTRQLKTVNFCFFSRLIHFIPPSFRVRQVVGLVSSYFRQWNSGNIKSRRRGPSRIWLCLLQPGPSLTECVTRRTVRVSGAERPHSSIFIVFESQWFSVRSHRNCTGLQDPLGYLLSPLSGSTSLHNSRQSTMVVSWIYVMSFLSLDVCGCRCSLQIFVSSRSLLSLMMAASRWAQRKSKIARRSTSAQRAAWRHWNDRNTKINNQYIQFRHPACRRLGLLWQQWVKRQKVCGLSDSFCHFCKHASIINLRINIFAWEQLPVRTTRRPRVPQTRCAARDPTVFFKLLWLWKGGWQPHSNTERSSVCCPRQSSKGKVGGFELSWVQFTGQA